jgi:hypothetical protein
VVNFVGIVIVIAGFLAHPIIGVVLLLVWVVIALALAIPSTAWKVVGISAGTLVLLVAGSALLMRP